MQYFLVSLFFVVACSNTSNFQVKKNNIHRDASSRVVNLWPEGTEGINTSINELEKPQGKRFYNIHNPTLTVYKPESPNGTAIIICPGGGYDYVASGVEGYPTAQILAESGVTVFVLKYRLPNTPGINFKHPVPLFDALRAIQLVRYHSESLSVDPNRIGIMGFSAGGHLASMAGTLFNSYSSGSDEISKIHSRPDFMCLVYPVISTEESIFHISIKHLLSSISVDSIPDILSSELNVSAKTPPTFLVHAKDDQAVKCQNSVVMYEALKKYGIPTDLKLYSAGGHGFGIGREGTDSANWLSDFMFWLSEMKFLSP